MNSIQLPAAVRLAALFLPATLGACATGLGAENLEVDSDPPSVSDTSIPTPPVAVCSVEPSVVRLLETTSFVGADSRDYDGTPIESWQWTLITSPYGSSATLGGAGADRVFTADRPGQYAAQLVVTAADGRVSEPCTAVLEVMEEDPVESYFWNWPECGGDGSATGCTATADGQLGDAMITLTDVSVGGGGPVLHVSRGGLIDVAFTTDFHCGNNCSGQIDQILVGTMLEKQPDYCGWSGNIRSGSARIEGAVVIPDVPGAYPIRVARSQAYTCDSAMEGRWWGWRARSSMENLGVVIVGDYCDPSCPDGSLCEENLPICEDADGWTTIADYDFSEHACPGQWDEAEQGGCRRTATRADTARAWFGDPDLEFSEVRFRLAADTVGVTGAFNSAYANPTLNSGYLDGLSVQLIGADGSRSHVFSAAASSNATESPCPSEGGASPPDFVESYTCETDEGLEAYLFEGEEFTVNVGGSTQGVVEARLSGDEHSAIGDLILHKLEIAVR